MLLELILALILGCLFGTLTGLSPGIHINLISAILVSSLAYFSNLPLISLAVFIVSMSITHTFLDFIPSIFLGAPEEDNFLSILPGHRMLLEGRAHEAFILTLYGSILAIPIILLLTPIFILYLPSLFDIIKSFIPFILIFLSLFIILRDEDFFLSLIVFFLSGLLGLLTFHLPVQQPLLPLLSGLFGLSGLLFSLKSKTKIQKQNLYALSQVKLTKREFSRSLFSSSLFAPLCSFLPGIGSGHAATLSSEFTEQNPRQFLFSLGIINTVIMGLSYVTVYSISKARTGTAASVQEILKSITNLDLSIILLAIVLSGIIAFIISLAVSRVFVVFLNKINYKYLTMGIIGILILVNILLSNWLGLLVLATSTFLGFFTISSNARRINLMACLILPSISYYLF